MKNKLNWYRIANKADTSTIYIYDEIGYYGVTASDFVTDLASLDTKRITLHLNTPGGSVFDGNTIYNALVRHPANIDVHIDGVAASMGSLIAMAGDTINMASNAVFMIHDPWSMVAGNSDDMRKEADLLDKVKYALVATYAARTGNKSVDIEDWMAGETWFNAEEAKDAGFIDSITEAKTIENKHDLTVFDKVPDNVQAEYGSGNLTSIRLVEASLREAGLSRLAAKVFLGSNKAKQREAVESGEVVPEEYVNGLRLLNQKYAILLERE